MTSTSWLPPGKHAAVCFSIDDVHPTAADADHDVCEISHQVLDRVTALLERHPHLRVTLFTTPDWRARGVHTSSTLVRMLPLLGRFLYATRPHPRGTLRVDRHHDVARRLASMPHAEVALHGLHHVRRGLRPAAECEALGPRATRHLLMQGQAIMASAGVALVAGFAPPAWDAPDTLLEALHHAKFRFLASARDLDTPVTPGAHAQGSGLRGVQLYAPELLDDWALVHMPSNFQATSATDRAIAIIEQGGLLSVKAHFLTRLGSYVALDGFDDSYLAQLDTLFAMLDRRYGSALWWPSLSDVAERVHAQAAQERMAS